MKKSIFAMAAATAFTGAAQAQSSVTVYGIMDVGYTNGYARSSPAGNGVVTSQSVSRISNSMESGSRIGFRGTEDLGGGTRANFVFELGVQPAGQAGSNSSGVPDSAAANASTAANAGAPTWAPFVRQAFVGLSQKGIGELRIGTQNTLNWEQAGANTAGQLNQTAGSMLAPTIDGAFFSSSALATTQAGTTITNGAALGAFTNRTTNTVTFRTERMSGLQAKAGMVLSNSNQTQAAATGNTTAGTYSGGNNNQYGWMAALDYKIGKANIQASTQVFKSENPYGSVSYSASCASTGAACSGGAASSTGGVLAWGTGTQGTNIVDQQSLITASYDFGILTAYAGWVDRKLTGTVNANNFMKRTAQEIGVRGYATKTIEGWASIGNGRYTTYGTNAPTANITGYQLGTNYWMSKRTNLYAIYGANATSSTSLGAASVTQGSVGIRHTF